MPDKPMPLGSGPLQVAIAGAASLRGKDLKLWMEESGFPAGEIALLDDEVVAGTLTQVAGEPTVIRGVDESSFEGMRFVFFVGSPAFAAKHGPAAERARATTIDLTGGLAQVPGARPWIPRLDAVLTPPPTDPSGARANICVSPSTPAIVACSLSAALAELSLTRLSIVFLMPASERGQAGVEELEAQTVKLLSLQPAPDQVFGTQVAFNLMDRWGDSSKERLSDVRANVTREVAVYLAGRVPVPAVTLLQAPVFYAYGFAAYAEFSEACDPDALATKLEAAGFNIAGGSTPTASNMSAAGEAQPLIGRAEQDSNHSNGYWFWGSADNLRVASANALRIAERLLAS